MKLKTENQQGKSIKTKAAYFEKYKIKKALVKLIKKKKENTNYQYRNERQVCHY